MSEIFIIASHSSPPGTSPSAASPRLDYYPPLSTTTEPRSLLLVCKSWNTLATSTAGLWAKFHVNHDGFLHFSKNVSMVERRRLKIWLKLSESAPLSIKISVPNLRNIPLELMEARERFRSLTLLGSVHFFHRIKPLMEELNSMVSLECLYLDVVEPDRGPPAPFSRYLNIQSLHHLRRLVVFENHTITWATPNGLTHLSISRLPIHEFRRILSSCPSLVEFETALYSYTDDYSDDSVTTSRIFKHTSLQSLGLTGNEKALATVLCYLELPILHNFKVYSERGGDEDNLPASLLKFVRRSSSTLEMLHISIPRHPDSVIIDLLEYGPQLKTVQVTTLRLTNGTVRKLRALPTSGDTSGSQPYLCPRLKELWWAFKRRRLWLLIA